MKKSETILCLAFTAFNEKNFLKSVTVLTVIISLYFNKTKKKLNGFIYIALAKHCWVIKLGKFKSDQKYFAR